MSDKKNAPLFVSSSINVFDTNKNNYFTGAPDFRHDKLDFDPLVTGYAFIIWTKIPDWVDTNFGRGKFADFTQKYFKSFSGLNDIELQTGEITYGFGGNQYNVATNIQKQNTDFSMRFDEFSGSPVKNMFQFWVTGIRDTETGIATYPRAYGLDYKAKNHTGELLYIVTRPDANNIEAKGRNIEFAAYYTNVFPTRIPLQHLNYEQGQHDMQPIEISFKGNLHLSPKVDEMAARELKKVYAFQTESDFQPL